MSTLPLSADLTNEVLAHLKVASAPPTLALLDALVAAYTRVVPWESAFRIAKRAGTENTADCPRWPEEFWQDAMARGGGGTCYESNYAFFRLLLALGYEGYLTVNNMNTMVRCHTAIVLTLEGSAWLVDVGLPLLTPIPLDTSAPTQRKSLLVSYDVRPDGESRYQIERNPHPSPYAFTLIDRPVNDDDYRAATTGDYGPGGLFLNRVIVNKIIDDHIWRFNSAETPLRLEVFEGDKRIDHPIEGDAAEVVGKHFSMDVDTVRVALAIVENEGKLASN